MVTRSKAIRQGRESIARRVWKLISTDRSKTNQHRLSASQLTSVFNLLATLLDNGMPLQKAISALSSDPSMKKHRAILGRIHNRIVAGTSLHVALSSFPKAFPSTVVQQVKLGELSGKLGDTLNRLVEQIEGWLAIRNNLLQKLSYPALVITAGSGLMAFMLTVVVPQFEAIYTESNVELPWVTSVVTGLSRVLGRNAWILILPVVVCLMLWTRIRSNVSARRKFHRFLTRLPLVGTVIRDLAMLQFLKSVHSLSEAGFVPLDAVTSACATVSNRHVRGKLEKMSIALGNGTKLSDALNTLEEYVPSAVRQLMMVGEHSGNITNAASGSCDFLQNRLQRRISAAMSLIEPLLTVGLATCIGWIVLAMYMPMFKMFDVLDY